MIISVNWLKKYTSIDLDIKSLEEKVNSRLVEVESIENLGDKYKDAYAVKVVSAHVIEGSDHLHVVKIDDNRSRGGVERDENGYVQVVCGAPNVKEGMVAVWLPPESVVPKTYGDKEPFKLASRELRGVMSHGMLASPDELDLFDDHSGIIELDENLQPGVSFADTYELNDYLFDIENKSLTHRPDVFGVIGFAREVAAIQGKRFNSPEWLKLESVSYKTLDESKLPTITIDQPELSSQYCAVVLTDVDSTKKSPLLVQTYLARIGMRPINAPVDVTNYLMMTTGQPMHTFDYDKLIALSGGKPEIHVRLGREGEKLLLLDGKEIEVSSEDIVISAGETAIGLAGGMGCKNTAVDENTKNILLEVATFNLYNMRSTQMRHGIFSEAITRFTKGQPSGLGLPVLHEAVRLLGEWSGSRPVSDVVVAKGIEDKNQPVELGVDATNRLLGTKLTKDEIVSTLENVEFTVDVRDDNLLVTAPYWRTDIHIEEDLIEEVGRLMGFDAIKPTIPKRSMNAIKPSDFYNFQKNIKTLLSRAGSNEVYNYSFIHGDDLGRNGIDKNNSYRIINAISPELQYYRQSLIPSLVGLVHPNIKSGYDEFALFEINKVHQKSFGLDDENMPLEKNSLALVLSNKKKNEGSFYKTKYILSFVLDFLNIDFRVEPISEESNVFSLPFEPKRSAKVICQDTIVGYIGEFNVSVKAANKLPEYTAGFEIDLGKLYAFYDKDKSNYSPISRFPSTDRDICFQLDKEKTYGSIETSLNNLAKNYDMSISVEPRDIYRLENSDKKNITVRLVFESENKTLVSEEVNQVAKEMAEEIVNKFDASII